jgi:hypothetical protein
VVDGFDAAEVKRLVSDALRLRANFIAPVAQNVHVNGQPDCEETQIERRPRCGPAPVSVARRSR